MYDPELGFQLAHIPNSSLLGLDVFSVPIYGIKLYLMYSLELSLNVCELFSFIIER